MKRFYELKFGQEGKKDYNPRDRRGSVIPEFPATKKGVSPRASLIPQPRDSFKSNREELVVEKKIKLSQNLSKPVKQNSQIKDKGRGVNATNLLREREELSNRLMFIQQLITTDRESDKQLLSKVRDFIGGMSQKESEAERLLCLKQESESLLQDNDNYLLTGSPQGEFSFVIEGESL